jgi:hypothetical protein
MYENCVNEDLRTAFSDGYIQHRTDADALNPLALCFATAPSANASPTYTTYSVNYTASGVVEQGQCLASGTGTITIDSGVGDANYGGLSFVSTNFTSAGGCTATGDMASNGSSVAVYHNNFDDVATFKTGNNPTTTASELVALDPGTYYLQGYLCWTANNCTNNGADLAPPPGGTFDVVISGGNIELEAKTDNGSSYITTTTPTPEPASFFLFGSGLLFLGMIVRKKLDPRRTV